MIVEPITFFVLGEPKGQPRARPFSRTINGKTVVRMYDPASAEAWKNCIAIAARQHCPFLPLQGPIGLDLTFVFPRPRNHYGTGKNALRLKLDAPRYHTNKPDEDNCTKAVKDALTILGFWRDDCQVCAGLRIKVYTGFGLFTQPGLHLVIRPLECQAEPPQQRKFPFAPGALTPGQQNAVNQP